jgi:thiosulfate dehydrogenase
MKRDLVKRLGLVSIPVALAALVAAGSVSARQPYTKEELAQQEQKLVAMVDRGSALWHGARADMSNNGLACGNCHPDGAAANPQTFPKFMPMMDKVVAFRDMVNWCIENPQGGKPLDVNSPDMVALEAYAFYLHRGEKIEPGLATRQTVPVAVKSGMGYPRKPTGVGYDTK